MLHAHNCLTVLSTQFRNCGVSRKKQKHRGSPKEREPRPVTRGSALLIAWRESRDLTQWDAAKHLGLHPTYVSRYERGQPPNLANALRIAEATDGEVPAESWTEPENHANAS